MADEKVIKDAQYRKGLSIAFFNATNAAVEFAKINGLVGVPDAKKFIAEWRDWFLEEHKNYYATVIASVGAPYNVEKIVKALKDTSSLEGLQVVWITLSADARKDLEILKVAKEERAKYPKLPINKKPAKNEKA